MRAHNAREARAITEKHILDGADGVIAMLEARGLWAERETAS